MQRATRALSGSLLLKSFIFLVPRGGLEPPRPCGLRILSPLRLPISPSGHGAGRSVSYILNETQDEFEVAASPRGYELTTKHLRS
jgi:hypothetical protein